MGGFLPCWDLDNREGFPHRHFHMGSARVPQTGERGAYHLGVGIPSPRGGAIMAASNPLHRFPSRALDARTETYTEKYQDGPASSGHVFYSFSLSLLVVLGIKPRTHHV